ncbi:MAG: NUDIX domain-containing protein [Pirellulales bacterium]|nr:NUDIX domain-containing protein [Pirellulales bacterium]
MVRETRFLVIRRSQTVVAPGAFCFPGGAIESGESEEQALVRELREELALEVRPKKRLWQSVTPWRVELSWWQAEFDLAGIPTPNPAEVESFHWYTTAEMRALAGLLSSNLAFLEAADAGEFLLD